MKTFKKLINESKWIVWLLLIALPVNSQVYLQSETKRLNKGKVISTKSEILLETSNGQMAVHYFQPDEFYVFTNVYGEMTVFFPKSNEVMKQQNIFYSSENELIYHFFTQQASDLGLSASGFTVENTRYDEQYLVTTWKAPAIISSKIVKAELAQEDYLPIYLAFYDNNSKVIQKTYFADWQNSDAAYYPTRVTQIDYVAANDSIVSRKLYKDILTGEPAKKRFNTITIPENAKLITTRK